MHTRSSREAFIEFYFVGSTVGRKTVDTLAKEEIGCCITHKNLSFIVFKSRGREIRNKQQQRSYLYRL